MSNARDEITAQRGAEISSRLARAGWLVASRAEAGLDWWAAEIWALESTWTPQAARAYLTFLVDPQYETFGRRVWAVGLAAAEPRSREEAATAGTFTLRHCWPGELASLLECLAALRAR